MPCITHHYACECRERRMELLEELAQEVKSALREQENDEECQCCGNNSAIFMELERLMDEMKKAE